MSVLSLSERPSARRWLALATLLAPFALVGLGGVWAWRVAEDQRAELAATEARVAGLERRLRTREQLLAELRLLEESGEAAVQLVQAESAALAGAELQGLITAIIDDAGGVTGSVQVLPPEPIEGFVRLPLAVEFDADALALREALHKLENNQPVLIVEELAIDPDLYALEDQSVPLRVRARVAAFARPFPEIPDDRTDAGEEGLGSAAVEPAAGPPASP